jgi:hypothetical protein
MGRSALDAMAAPELSHQQNIIAVSHARIG